MSVSYNSPLPPGGGPVLQTGRVDFGWLGQAWSLFSAQAGTWIGAMLLCFLVDALVWAAVAVPTGMLASLRAIYMAIVTQKPPLPGHPYQEFAQSKVFAILVAGIAAVFAGGLYRMGLAQRRGEPISALGVFSALPQALPLGIVGAAVPVLTSLLEGFLLWILHFFLAPALAVSAVNFVAWLPALILPGLFMFAPLLIVDRGVSAPAALRGSVSLLGRQWLMGILFYVVASLVGGLGAAVCGVGMLATYPIFLLSIAVGYVALVYPPVPGPAFIPPPVQSGVWPPPPNPALPGSGETPNAGQGE